MKLKFTFLLAAFVSCHLLSFAQNDFAGMVDIQVSDESNLVLSDIRTSLSEIVNSHDMRVQLRNEISTRRYKTIAENSRATTLQQKGSLIPKDTLLTGLVIVLSYREENDDCGVPYTVYAPDRQYELGSGVITKSRYLISKPEIRRLVAYEIFDRTFTSELSEDGKRVFSRLKQYEADLNKGIADKQIQYTLLSFLPPVNQFRSKTQKGKANGIAILAGYGISVGSFIYCTASYNANKRKYEGVTIDLSEADKAREHYKGQMDLCRTGQIASGILFVGTYVYGVANALVNRGAYLGTPRESGMKIAPTAYGNGAGLALVYRF